MTSKLPAATRMGAIHLRARDAPRLARWYAHALGLAPQAPDKDGAIALHASGEPLVVLHPAPDAPARAPHESGLFHVALLVPERKDLATLLTHLLDTGVRVSGAADHLVSEAIYLEDLEGNGIELYADRPRETWKRTPDGALEMATLALDIKDLLAHARPGQELALGMGVGHVHLQVRDVAAAEAFYRDVVGFDLMARYGGDASFLSAGRYHHHLGVNAWGTRGGPAASGDALGLARFTVVVPDAGAVEAARERLGASGALQSARDGVVLGQDPSGNTFEVRAREKGDAFGARP